MTEAMSRHLPLEGTYNVRDLGGYATRDGGVTQWRTLFRADGLHRMSPEAQVSLLSHGVRQVIDLRRSNELETAPNVFAGSDRVTYRHLSLLVDELPLVQGDPTPLVETYRCILDERQEQVRTVLAHFAEPDGLPAVFHCTAGKDRTGVIAALLLGLVGVPDETIVADYALTTTYLGDGFIAEMRERAEQRGYTWEQYQPLVISPPEFMASTLTYLRQTYGDSEAYLRGIGLSETQLEQLRQAFLAPT